MQKKSKVDDFLYVILWAENIFSVQLHRHFEKLDNNKST